MCVSVESEGILRLHLVLLEELSENVGRQLSAVCQYVTDIEDDTRDLQIRSLCSQSACWKDHRFSGLVVDITTAQRFEKQLPVTY